jgi:hypothetical protein
MKRIAVVLLATALAACGSDPPTQPPSPPIGLVNVTMDAAKWQFVYSPNMPHNPSAHPQGWSFKFPKVDGVHHVVYPGSRGQLGQKVWASFQVERAPGASFKETDPCGSHNAKARLFFQRAFDDFSGAGDKEFYRWFSIATYSLPEGTSSGMSVMVQPDQWVSVMGKNGSLNPNEFWAASNDIGTVGFAFGGCFAAHGAYEETGESQFVATSFSAR